MSCRYCSAPDGHHETFCPHLPKIPKNQVSSLLDEICSRAEYVTSMAACIKTKEGNYFLVTTPNFDFTDLEVFHDMMRERGQ